MEPPRDTIEPEKLLAQLGWVKALAHRLVVDPNVADDVLQRVCLTALEKPPRDVRGEAGLRRWLSTLTRRLASHSQRSDRRRARRERVAARSEGQPATVDVAARREVMRSLVDAVTGLEERDFTVIVQRYFDGLDIRDIAARQELSPEAVRQRLSRARIRLRERLEQGAGPDRQRWLAVLAPLAVPATLARDVPQIVLWKKLGALVMAKSASALGVKIAVGVSLVSIVAFTTWQALDEPAPSEPVPAMSVPSIASPQPIETGELPVVPSELSREPSPLPVAPATSGVHAPADQEVVSASTGTGKTGGGLSLDPALESFLSQSPDLQALNQLLRRLAQSARVLADTVARNPEDDSLRGWIVHAGSDQMGEFIIDADGGYHLALPIVREGLPQPYGALDLRVDFRNDAGRAAGVETVVEFHPDQASETYESFLESLADHPRTVGWLLSVGHDGTTGHPIRLQRHENALTATVHGGEPDLSASWANDTSPYDLWLSLLRGLEP